MIGLAHWGQWPLTSRSEPRRGFWHWRQEASSPRARSASALKLRGGYLLPFPGSLEAQFRLGQPGSRSLELAGGSRELTFPLACALVRTRIEAPLEERDERLR